MLPLFEKEIIDKRKWLDNKIYSDMLSIAQSAPGPIALNVAVFVGYRLKRAWGSIFAVAGVVIPSFVILLLIAVYLPDITSNRWLSAAFSGMRPAVIALIAAPLLRLGKGLSLWQIIAAATTLALIWLLGVSPIYILLLGAVVGITKTYMGR